MARRGGSAAAGGGGVGRNSVKLRVLPSGTHLGQALVWRGAGNLLLVRTAGQKPMLDQIYNAPQTATEILGDLTALAEQLGSAEAPCALSLAATSLGSAQVRTLPGLRQFLADYTAGLLIPIELPTVVGAFQHSSRYQLRELIALDNELAQKPALQSFAAASCSVGRTQLRRLRPLRDERIVQRYFQAVEAGKAKGWHTVVFGLVLATYSLPLRQGLIHFAQRTLGGFVEAASNQFTVANREREELLSALGQTISTGVETVVRQQVPMTACFGAALPDVRELS